MCIYKLLCTILNLECTPHPMIHRQWKCSFEQVSKITNEIMPQMRSSPKIAPRTGPRPLTDERRIGCCCLLCRRGANFLYHRILCLYLDPDKGRADAQRERGYVRLTCASHQPRINDNYDFSDIRRSGRIQSAGTALSCLPLAY